LIFFRSWATSVALNPHVELPLSFSVSKFPPPKYRPPFAVLSFLALVSSQDALSPPFLPSPSRRISAPPVLPFDRFLFTPGCFSRSRPPLSAKEHFSGARTRSFSFPPVAGGGEMTEALFLSLPPPYCLFPLPRKASNVPAGKPREPIPSPPVVPSQSVWSLPAFARS